MKTTLEIPDALFKRVKLSSVSSGTTLKRYIAEALETRLSQESSKNVEKPWMKNFGNLSHLRKETRRIEKIIENEFEAIDSEGWK